MFNINNLIQGRKLHLPYFEELSKAIYYSTGLGVQIIDGQMNLNYQYGKKSSIIDTFPDMYQGFEQFIKKIQAKITNGVSSFTTQYELSYIVGIISTDKQYYGSILLGPIMLSPINEQMLSSVLVKTNQGLAKRATIKCAYDSITVVNQARNYYLSQLLHNLLASNICVTNDMFDDYNTISTIPMEPVEAFNDMENFNYELERLFINKVSAGDVENVGTLFHNQVKPHYFTSMNLEDLRPIKNNAVKLSTLLSRAAIKGGVDSNNALSMAEQYNHRIEDLFRYSELISLSEQMATDFTNQVLQISEVNHANVVKKVSKYIHSHMSESIRLNDVATYVELSPNYFSSLFKREMGIAFADYLNQSRVLESQHLLETTDYPIIDIAMATGFNNQNYFTTIFRKHTGTTPKQFRMKVSIK